MSIFSRIFSRKTKPQIDSWKGHERFYVSAYREALDGVAEELSKEGSPMHVRFNPKRKCAELSFKSGITVAQIRVNGQFGSPYEAVITAFHLTDRMKEMISGVFSESLKKKFELP